MSTNAIINHKTILAAGATVIVLYWLGKREVQQAADEIGDAVNPISDENIINRGVDALVQKLTGDPTETLGGWLSDWLNRDEIEAAHQGFAAMTPEQREAVLNRGTSGGTQA